MKRITRLLPIAAALVLVACVRYRVEEGTHPPVTVPGPDTQVRFNNVSIVDDSLAGKIAVGGSNWQPNPTGTANVWAQLRNRTDYLLRVEARTQFFDKAGAPLDKPSAWQRLTLGPNTITTYRENSTHPESAYYYIEVREAR